MPSVAIKTGNKIIFLIRGHTNNAFVFSIKSTKKVFRELNLRNWIKNGRRRIDTILSGSKASHYYDDDQNENEEVEDEKQIAHQQEQKHALGVAAIKFVHALFILVVVISCFTSPFKKDKVTVDLPTKVADFKNQISE